MTPSSDTLNECMTIVVPVYNRPALIVRCLDSLKAQTYRPIHVIVVDNASTDDTLCHVQEWKEANERDCFSVDVISESRPGAPFARQAGLARVQTEKVMFFDSDDVMRPECVAGVMEAWRRDPVADLVAWPVVIHKAESPFVTHAVKGRLLERHLVHALLRTQGYAVKSAFLKSCGGWRGEYPVWNDFETGCRLLLSDPKVAPIAVPLVDVYPQAESITGTGFHQKAGKWEKSLDAIDAYIAESGRKEAGRLHNIVSYRRAILAADYAKEGYPELAGPLYGQALSEVPIKKRPLIRFAYHWTRLGMRGAFSVVGKFL